MKRHGLILVPTDDDHEIVDAWFERLARALAVHPVPCKDGTTRTATAGEFMLMHLDSDDGRWPTRAAFKHSTTRNYLGVTVDGTLDIPADGSPWAQGYFDSGEAV